MYCRVPYEEARLSYFVFHFPKSVLIVDDHPSIRTGLRFFLEQQAGLVVCGEAANGTEAVKVATERKPDLVLMDLRMPEMNGAEAAAVIRRALPNTRIVVFTLFSDSFGKTVEKFSGVDLVVAKSEGLTGLTKGLYELFAGSSL